MKKIFILKQLNNINIRNKLLFSYILVLLPVLLIGLVLTFSIKELVTERAMYEANNSVERICGRLNEPLKLAQNLFGQLKMDTDLENLVQTRYQSANDVVDAYSRYSRITNCTGYYSREIEDIRLYTYNNTMLNSAQFVIVDDNTAEQPWFQLATSLNGEMYWQTVYNPFRGSSFLSLTTLLISPTQWKPLGVLVVNIKQSCLTSIVEDELYETIILDDRGFVLAAKESDLVGKELDLPGLKDLSGMPSGIHDIVYDKRPSKAIIKTFIPGVSNKAFRIISVVPVSTITSKVTDTFKLGFLMLMVSLMLAVVLFSFFSNAISKRVKSVSRDMHTVAHGNFDFSPSIEGEDEIGQLSRDLGVMVKSIKDLMHEVYKVNMQKNQLAVRQREIKLKMLASQINPHFLFNALESIRMKAYCHGETEIAEVIWLLGKIMRRTLEAGNELVFFSEEIDLVKGYLEIQKFRYESRFTYTLTFDNALMNYKLLPFIIQPIVENAVVHGLEFMEEGGEVRLTAKKDCGILRIIVEDNGCGMDEERLRQVMEGLNQVEDTSGQHIGLKNVHQRIRLYYGEEYGLTVESSAGNGTSVVITLPI